MPIKRPAKQPASGLYAYFDNTTDYTMNVTSRNIPNGDPPSSQMLNQQFEELTKNHKRVQKRIKPFHERGLLPDFSNVGKFNNKLPVLVDEYNSINNRLNEFISKYGIFIKQRKNSYGKFNMDMYNDSQQTKAISSHIQQENGNGHFLFKDNSAGIVTDGTHTNSGQRCDIYGHQNHDQYAQYGFNHSPTSFDPFVRENEYQQTNGGFFQNKKNLDMGAVDGLKNVQLHTFEGKLNNTRSNNKNGTWNEQNKNRFDVPTQPYANKIQDQRSNLFNTGLLNENIQTRSNLQATAVNHDSQFKNNQGVSNQQHIYDGVVENTRNNYELPNQHENNKIVHSNMLKQNSANKNFINERASAFLGKNDFNINKENQNPNSTIPTFMNNGKNYNTMGNHNQNGINQPPQRNNLHHNTNDQMNYNHPQTNNTPRSFMGNNPQFIQSQNEHRQLFDQENFNNNEMFGNQNRGINPNVFYIEVPIQNQTQRIRPQPIHTHVNPNVFQTQNFQAEQNQPVIEPTRENYEHFLGPFPLYNKNPISNMKDDNIFSSSSIEKPNLSDVKAKVEEMLGDIKFTDEGMKYFLEMCDQFIEGVCNTACQIASARNSKFLDLEDMKMSMCSDFNVGIPDTAKNATAFTHDAEHSRKMALIQKEQNKRSKM